LAKKIPVKGGLYMSANSTINLTIAEYGEPYLWQLWLQQLAF